MSLWQDFRYGARRLRNAPGFALTSIVTMALGIGVTTAIFSTCDALLWKPLPLPGLDRLVTVMRAVPDNPNDWNSATPGEIGEIRRDAQSLSSLASWEQGEANLSSSGEPDRVLQSLVTANFFSVSGVQPARGRAFQVGEDQPGREREAILSNGLWQRRFAGNPAIVGQSVRIDDQNYTVVGVMPPSFDFPIATELWTPLALTPEQQESRRARVLESIGQLRAGYSVTAAAAEIDGIARRLEKAYPDTNKNQRFAVWPALKFLVDPITQQYLEMLLGSVAFVLLIACANVANLQFARATGRVREVAMRRALGASRGQVLTQLIAESMLITFVGGLCGLLVAKWGMTAIRVAMPPEIARYILGWNDIRLDSRAILFTLVAAVVSGILAGLAPAWQSSKANLAGTLKEGGRSSSVGKGRQRVRSVLVSAEIALAVVLLVGAGLMVRGFNALMARGEALEPATLLTLHLSITEQRYREPHQVAGFYRQVIERIKALPGVRAGAAVSALPYSDHSNSRDFRIEGRQIDPADRPTVMYQVTTPDYFGVLHIPLLKGRLLSENDGPEAPKVALVSERMAQHWWPNESPIGKRIKIEPAAKSEWMTVVGVVGDIVHNPNEHQMRRTIYVPYEQAPTLSMDVGVRTAGNPLDTAGAVRAAVHVVDPDQPVTEMRTLEKLIHNRAIGLNYMAALMGVFGGVALLLSAVGVYGVMANMVSEQTQEIGVRVALGAQTGKVLNMIFRRGMLTTGLGLAAGLPVAYLLARLMSSLIYGIPATDPATFAGITVTLLGVAALAIYIPARRATRIDPIVALRYE